MGSISSILKDSKGENYCSNFTQGFAIEQVTNLTNKNIQEVKNDSYGE